MKFENYEFYFADMQAVKDWKSHHKSALFGVYMFVPYLVFFYSVSQMMDQEEFGTSAFLLILVSIIYSILCIIVAFKLREKVVYSQIVYVKEDTGRMWRVIVPFINLIRGYDFTKHTKIMKKNYLEKLTEKEKEEMLKCIVEFIKDHKGNKVTLREHFSAREIKRIGGLFNVEARTEIVTRMDNIEVTKDKALVWCVDCQDHEKVRSFKISKFYKDLHLTPNAIEYFSSTKCTQYHAIACATAIIFSILFLIIK